MNEKYCSATLSVVVVLLSLFIALFVVQSKMLSDYKEAFEVLKEAQNTVVLQMDESCYKQFVNNFDKALYIKMRFK